VKQARSRLGVGLPGFFPGLWVWMFPVALEAQQATGVDGGIVVIGVIEDQVQKTPLAQASIRFLRGESEGSPTVASDAISGADGRYNTRPLLPGVYRVEIRALGYRDFAESVVVDGASPMDLRVELSPLALELEAIVVVSRRSRTLENGGFYQRRAQGFGRTFTRDEILDRGYSRTTDLLRMVPGLSLSQNGPMASPTVVMRGNCAPDVILDGVNLGPNVPIDDLMPASNLEGLEVHRSATVPIRYRGNPCGAVVLWSLDPSVQEPGRPFSWKRMVGVGIFIVASILLTH